MEQAGVKAFVFHTRLINLSDSFNAKVPARVWRWHCWLSWWCCFLPTTSLSAHRFLLSYLFPRTATCRVHLSVSFTCAHCTYRNCLRKKNDCSVFVCLTAAKTRTAVPTGTVGYLGFVARPFRCGGVGAAAGRLRFTQPTHPSNINLNINTFYIFSINCENIENKIIMLLLISNDPIYTFLLNVVIYGTWVTAKWVGWLYLRCYIAE